MGNVGIVRLVDKGTGIIKVNSISKIKKIMAIR